MDRVEFDLTVRSNRLHAQRFGAPSALLIIGLPGLSGTVRTFDVIGGRIGGDAHQLVALDLRGRGGSERTPRGTYGWENHALDVFAVADALGFDHFSVIGQSMGGSVAMKAAELEGSRLDAVVLLDMAGRVDPGIGPVIASVIGALDPAVVSLEAVAEDRAYTLTQHPYERWKHLTMPTLLLRATRELRPGSGHVVPAEDVGRFRREVAGSIVVEIDADHETISSHPDTAAEVLAFLASRHLDG